MAVKVLVVDDSGFFRRRVSEILSSDSNIQVVGTATNGREAIDQVLALKPDVITMDYEMPMMDGITAVRQIMQRCPTPVLMFSSLTHEGARVTLDALDAGAVDYLPKNFEDISRNPDKVKQMLCEKVHTISRSNRRYSTFAPQASIRLRLRRVVLCRARPPIRCAPPVRLPLRRLFVRLRPSARHTNWLPSEPPPVAPWRCSAY